MNSSDFLSIVTPAQKESFTIGDLAREFDVTPRTIRHYEAEGLLSPRRDGQARIFSKRDRARLGWILRGKRVGFSLNDIAELLGMYEKANPARQRRALAARLDERIATLSAQRGDIDATIAELTEFKTTLSTDTKRTA